MEDMGAFVGRNVRRVRVAAGVSQEELAHRTGIDRSWLSDIERGLGNPSVRWLGDVAAALSTHPALFLLGEQQAAIVREIVSKGDSEAPP